MAKKLSLLLTLGKGVDDSALLEVLAELLLLRVGRLVRHRLASGGRARLRGGAVVHRGLEVRPSQGLEVWRVDVASRARDGAVVCWHKGLEVYGRGDVEAKGSYGESSNAVAHR